MLARLSIEQLASQLVFNVADCYITALQRQVYVVEVAEFIGQICKLHNKLFIVKLDMEVVFVFSKKDFNLTFKFLQLREAFASRQPRDFGIKQKFHMLSSHFFGQNLEKPVIFCPQTNEVDRFDPNVHNFYQT